MQTESNTEVDFVLTRDGEHLAVEVKVAGRYNTAPLKGLRAIADLPRLASRILLCGGRRALRTSEGTDVWPFDRFQQALADDRLWP